MTTGRIINIQRFCTKDGPGIRTTVFLKGCPLKCVWCHNPESQSGEREILFYADKCISCGACAVNCLKNCHKIENGHEYRKENCVKCGTCEKVCPTKAIEVCGTEISVDQVVETVKKDKEFYEVSGGGVTVSGGEPLFQAEFTIELLKECKKNSIHTAIETCGFADKKTFESVIKYCDLVLFDVKETNAEKHLSFTGAPLESILENLDVLNASDVPFIIRAPIIPTFNDRKEHFESLKKLKESLKNCQAIEIMPYHKIGEYKYGILGRENLLKDLKAPSKESVKNWQDTLKNN